MQQKHQKPKNTQQKHTNLLNNASSFFWSYNLWKSSSIGRNTSLINQPFPTESPEALKKLTLQGTNPYPTFWEVRKIIIDFKSGGWVWDISYFPGGKKKHIKTEKHIKTKLHHMRHASTRCLSPSMSWRPWLRRSPGRQGVNVPHRVVNVHHRDQSRSHGGGRWDRCVPRWRT